MNTKNLLIVVLFMLIPTLSLAWGTEINGIYYSFNTSDKTACVVSGHGEFEDGVKLQYYSGNIVIPEEVIFEGTTYKVTAIGGGRESRGMPKYDGAFEYSSITSIQIPKTIERIGEYTFQGCSSLATVSFDGNIKSIGIGAFKDCCSLVSFEIPEGVETLNYRTFEGCSSLESLSIPTTLTKIGGYMYGGFEKLKSLHIKNLSAWCNIEISDVMENPLYYAHHLYLNGEEVTELKIPSGTSTIGNYVFCGCEGITSVVFHKDVESIGKSSFWSCDNLETITIKGGDTKIKFEAFRYCSKLTDIYCDTEKCPEIVCDAIEYNGRFVFDENVYEDATLHVKDYAVESFKTNVVWSLFKNIDVEKLTDFKLTYYVDGDIFKTEQHKYEDEITSEPNPIKKGMTFSGWSDIPATMPGKDVDVTGTFTWAKDKIGGVIYQVTDTINNNAAVIGSDNARGEVKIVSPVKFDYDYSVTDIVDLVFKNNTDITSVVIPESVRKIGDEAFSGCKNLTKIELGKSVNQIEPRAFAGIDKLTDVTCYAENAPDADRTAFENSYIEYAILRVPANTDGNYRNTMPWSGFKDILPLEEIAPVETDIVTIKDSGKTSFCSEYDLDFTDIEGIKAYTATGYDDMDKTIWLTRVMKVPAGTGIMIKGTPGEYKIPHATVRATYANYFKGNLGETIRVEETEGDKTNYYLSGDGTFKSVNGYANIGKGKAYLQLPTSVFAGTRSIEVNYGDEEGTTGIRSLTPALSKGEGAYYNLQGQRVDKPGKGLYILNGKKVIVR